MAEATDAAARPGKTTLAEVEQFLYREAWLLDRHRFDDWLALYTEDATYWVPLEPGQQDAIATSSIIYDDRTLLQIRVNQYKHPRAHARLPLARTCHQVGNVMILGENAPENEILAGSTLVLIEYRRERQRVFGAACEHRLHCTPEGLRIAAKRIDIVNSQAELDGIAFLF